MATSNRIRALNRLPFDFEDGLKVGGVDVTALNQTFTPAGAGLIGFTPVGNLAAGNVQAALAELDSKKIAFTRLDDADGSSLVGYDGGTVQDVMDSAKPMADYTALRAYTGRATSVRITSNGIAGFFYRDDADTVSADNGGTIIVASNGKRWKRLHDGIFNVRWFGAKGDWNGSTGTDDTLAIQAALNASAENVFLPEGNFKVSSTLTLANKTTLFGSGYGSSKLYCNTPGVDIIKATYRRDITIRDLTLEGDKTNRDGIVFDGVVWGIVQNVYILKMGRHGVFCTDSGTPYLGCYPVIVNKVHVEQCAGNGLDIVATGGLVQMNGVFISNCELQTCVNGVRLWGAKVVFSNNISEGNSNYGVLLEATKQTGGTFSASNIEIDNNYFEANQLGHIRAKTGQNDYGAIVGLSIKNNYGWNGNIVTIPVVFERFSDANSASKENLVRGLIYKQNNFTASSAYTVVADFDNQLSPGCVIEGISGLNSSSSTSLVIGALVTSHVNLGAAKLNKAIKACSVSGLLSKGGSGIVYTAPEKSDNITVNNSEVYFPVSLPNDTLFERVCIPVSTDSTNYSIQFTLLKRRYDSIDLYTENVFSVTKSAITTLSGLVDTGNFLQYAAYARLSGEYTDAILKVKVSWVSTPTNMRIGNPTIFYN